MAFAIPLLGRRFTPRLWPTLFALVGLCVLVALGTWQLDRSVWKTALLDRIAERLNSGPVPLPADIVDADAWDYKRATVTGHFLGVESVHLYGRIHQGRPGAQMLTPFLPLTGVTDGSRPGQQPLPVLVDRGWVPLERIQGPIEDGNRAPEPITLTGVLRLPSEPGWVTPANNRDANEWYWIDIPDMAAALDLDAALPLVLTLEPQDGLAADGGEGGTQPIPVNVRVTIPNNHLKYALTWFGLAGTLLIVYFLAQSRKRS